MLPDITDLVSDWLRDDHVRLEQSSDWLLPPEELPLEFLCGGLDWLGSRRIIFGMIVDCSVGHTVTLDFSLFLQGVLWGRVKLVLSVFSCIRYVWRHVLYSLRLWTVAGEVRGLVSPGERVNGDVVRCWRGSDGMNCESKFWIQGVGGWNRNLKQNNY